MNRWMRRIVAILEIGSGFACIMALLLSAPWARDSSPAALIISLAAVCLALLGIVAGLLMAESRPLGLWLSLLYQMAQIPIIASAAVTYQFLPVCKSWAVALANLGPSCSSVSRRSWSPSGGPPRRPVVG